VKAGGEKRMGQRWWHEAYREGEAKDREGVLKVWKVSVCSWQPPRATYRYEGVAKVVCRDDASLDICGLPKRCSVLTAIQEHNCLP
jgi:hypothetical protein